MVWAAIGTTVAGGLVGKIFGGKSKSAPQQVASTPGAAVSDPFASQRQQYQPMMQKLMGQARSGGVQFTDYSGDGKMTYRTGVPGEMFNPDVALNNPTSMKVDPASVFDDPSYNFRVSQGEAALDRAAARGGMIGSGNQMAELMTYGQNMATQEYDKIWGRNMGIHQQEQSDFNSMFQRGMQLHGQQEADFTNEFNRLAMLSGASGGSPAAAGQLVQQQAQQNQGNLNAVVGKVVDAAGNWIGNKANTWMSGSNDTREATPRPTTTTDPTGLNGIPKDWFGNTIG